MGIIVSSTLFLPAIASAAIPGNLITNPSVETANGSDPLFWNRGSWGGNDATFTYPVSGFDGSKAVRVTIRNYTSGDAKWYADDIVVTPKKMYTFSSAYHATAPTSLVIRYTSTAGTVSYVTLAATVPASATWKQVTYNFTVPSGMRSLSVWHVLRGVGELTTDHYGVVSQSATNANLISNPSFESRDGSGGPLSWRAGNWGVNDAAFIYPVEGFDTPSAAQIQMHSYTSGDAKWYFEPLDIVAEQKYHFSENYRSDVMTKVIVGYTFDDDVYRYELVANVFPSTDWKQFHAQITPPSGATQMTIFHLLDRVGTLSIDDQALISLAGVPDPDLFQQGMVSLTFDDGYASHYVHAYPMLNTAGMKGSFEIITKMVLDALPGNRIANHSLENADGSGDPVGWKRDAWGANNAVFTYPVPGYDGARAASVSISNYTDGDAKWQFNDVAVVDGADYAISDYYKSNVSTIVTAEYNMGNNVFVYEDIATLPPASKWTKFTRLVTIPAHVESFTFLHRLASVGSLTIDNAEFSEAQEYMSPAQLRAMQNSDHEIGAHTRTHPSLPGLSQTQLEDEIVGSRDDLFSMGISPVSMFVYPYGDYDPNVEMTTARAGFVAARSVDRGYNTRSTDKYALKIQQVDHETTVGEVRAWIDKATQDRTWLILAFHQIDGSGSDFSTTPSNLQAIINYLSTTHTPVVTMQQGVAQMH